MRSRQVRVFDEERILHVVRLRKIQRHAGVLLRQLRRRYLRCCHGRSGLFGVRVWNDFYGSGGVFDVHELRRRLLQFRRRIDLLDVRSGHEQLDRK